MHVHGDHVLVVLHTPETGRGGHVHYLQLDQLIGSRYLVTVHGPVDPAVDPALPTAAAVRRIRHRGRRRCGVGETLPGDRRMARLVAAGTF